MKQKLYTLLNAKNISFEEFLHPAMFTCDDIEKHEIKIPAADCKTLFLKNKKRYFLLSTLAHKRVDIKALSQNRRH